MTTERSDLRSDPDPGSADAASPVHHFTVDVEEYFQVSAMERWVPMSSWDALPGRVVESTQRILDILDTRGVYGTFFMLGWVAERHPALVREIVAAGHEVASHGWDHRRITELDPEGFRGQVRDSKRVLEEVTGSAVEGFRAPSFSIVPGREWALDILVEEGYRYDSSLYPVRRSGYGYPTAARDPAKIETANGSIIEFPPTTLRIFGMNLPAGGGGTFRQLPRFWTRRGLRSSERRGASGTFYIHPWEVDPEQPRIGGLPPLTRIRHYRGIAGVSEGLDRLLGAFRFGPIREHPLLAR